MPSAAAEPSLTSSSSGASGRGQAAGDDDRIARPGRHAGTVDLDHRRRPSRPVDARGDQHHRPRRPARRRARPASSGSAPSPTTGRRRCTPRARPESSGSTPSGQKSISTSGGSETADELVDGLRRCADRLPTSPSARRRRGRRARASDHRGDPVPSHERGRPHPSRLAAHVVAIVPGDTPKRPPCCHIAARVLPATPRPRPGDALHTERRHLLAWAPCGRSRCSWPTTAPSSVRACGRCWPGIPTSR